MAEQDFASMPEEAIREVGEITAQVLKLFTPAPKPQRERRAAFEQAIQTPEELLAAEQADPEEFARQMTLKLRREENG